MTTFKVAMWVLFVIFLVISFIILVFHPAKTTFNITAVVESVEFVVTEEMNPRMHFLDVLLVDGFETIEAEQFTGSFRVSADTKVLVNRKAKGPVIVTLEANSSNESVGQFFDRYDQLEGNAGEFVEFRIPDLEARAFLGQTTFIPIAGQITIGSDNSYPTVGGSPVLRNGKVTMLGESTIFGLRQLFGVELVQKVFKAGDFDLETGDSFFAMQTEQDARGFILANEEPALTITYRITGRKGQVIKQGRTMYTDNSFSNGYIISISALDRLVNDYSIQAISILFSAILGAFTLWTYVNRIIENPTRNNTSKSLPTPLMQNKVGETKDLQHTHHHSQKSRNKKGYSTYALIAVSLILLSLIRRYK